MSDPRDVETAVEAKASQPVEATGDGGDSGSSGQVIDEARERDLDPAPAFEDWRARAVDLGLGSAGGLGGLRDPGARLDGLAGDSAFHTPGLPGLDRSLDPGSLLDGRTSSDSALNQAAQAGRDTGPELGQSGGMSDHASGEGGPYGVGLKDYRQHQDTPNMMDDPAGGDSVTFAPVETRDAAGNVFTSTTTNTYGWDFDGHKYDLTATTTTTTTESPAGTPPPADPPATPPSTPPATPSDEEPDDEDPEDPDDDAGVTTGDDGPVSARTRAALDFIGVPEATIDRAGTAGPEYGPDGPGGPSDDKGGGMPDDPVDLPHTTGDDYRTLRDPATRPLTAGPEYVRGDPGGDGLDGGGPATAGGGGGGADTGRIGSDSFAMTADTDEAAGTAGTATGKDPGAFPDSGLTAGMATGKDPGAFPDSGNPGLATGKEPGAFPDSGNPGLATGKEPGALPEDDTSTADPAAAQGPSTGPDDGDLSAGDSSIASVRGGPAGPVMDEGTIFVDTGRTVPVGFGGVRPGEPVSLTGVGDRFSGNVLVTAERQNLDAGNWAGGDEIFGSWSTPDQPGIAGSSATDTTGDVTAPTTGLFAGRDPSTISGSEDDDLEDLEVQRRTVRGGDVAATIDSAAGAGGDFVDTSHQDPRTVGLAGGVTADVFSTSIMGGLDAPVETAGIHAAPAPSTDVAPIIHDIDSPVTGDDTTFAPALAEAGLPPVDPAEMKIESVAQDDAAAGDLDLSVQVAELEIAPVAIEAHKEQPALEQLDPGLSAPEPPPDAPAMDEMDVPLP